MPVIEHGAQFANSPRQQLCHERGERGVLLAHRFEILPVRERTTNLSSRFVGARIVRRHQAELEPQLALALLRLGLRFIEQRARQHDAKECVAMHNVGWEGNHARRGQHIGDHRIVRQCTSLRQKAGNSSVQERRLDPLTDAMLAIQQRDVAPPMAVLIVISANVGHHPRLLLVVRFERERANGKGGGAVSARNDAVRENGRVREHEPAREREDILRAAVVLLEVDDRVGPEVEVVDERSEDFRIGAGPGIDGLFVVANGHDVAMVASERADDPILHRVEILEFVHQHDVPSRPQLRGGSPRPLEQLCRLDYQRVEVHELAIGEKPLVLVKEHHVVVLERIAAEAMGREPREHAAVPFARSFDAAKGVELVLLVRDAEARFEQHLGAELAQQLGAKSVNRSALDLLR